MNAILALCKSTMQYSAEAFITIVCLLGLAAIIYCISACFKEDQGGFPCFLCKEKVTEETWEQHRRDCARENEWFIEGLPKSEVS